MHFEEQFILQTPFPKHWVPLPRGRPRRRLRLWPGEPLVLPVRSSVQKQENDQDANAKEQPGPVVLLLHRHF